MSTTAQILVIDDDPSLQHVLEAALRAEGYAVEVAADAGAAEAALRRNVPDLVVLDLNLPGRSGFELLEAWQTRGLEMPVLILTAQDTVENAIRAMQLGAYDYLTKPFDLDELYGTIREALRQRRETTAAPPVPEDRARPLLVGTSPGMKQVYKVIGRVAATDATVLITGESGTGKELVARAIHAYSTRAHAPFVAVNAAAIPADLLEAELFGYEKGAFTGATQAFAGRFREAHGGTLLLDEIGDMPLGLQAKLLRVLQEREVTPLGAIRPVPVDVRILAATQIDLEEAVAAGRFRADLYYRLRVVEIDLPPLRERLGDIPVLCEHFLTQMAAKGEIPPKRISEDAIELLKSLQWPGNVRQLENVVRRVAVLSPHRVLDVTAFRRFGGDVPTLPIQGEEGFAQLLEQRLRPYVQAMASCGDEAVWETVIGSVEEVLIRLALEATGGNQLRAAKLLGVNRNTLRKKIGEYGIEPRAYRPK